MTYPSDLECDKWRAVFGDRWTTRDSNTLANFVSNAKTRNLQLIWHSKIR